MADLVQGALSFVRFDRSVDSSAGLLNCIANSARNLLNRWAPDQLIHRLRSVVERLLDYGPRAFAGGQSTATPNAIARL